MEQLLFTSSSLLDLLSQLPELSDKSISVYETEEGVSIEIDNSIYMIPSSFADEVQVSSYTIEEVNDINSSNFSELENSGMTVEFTESIECGILGQILKTLAVGGLVRLTNKLLKK